MVKLRWRVTRRVMVGVLVAFALAVGWIVAPPGARDVQRADAGIGGMVMTNADLEPQDAYRHGIDPIYALVRSDFFSGFVCLAMRGVRSCATAKIPIPPLNSDAVPLYAPGAVNIGAYDLISVDADSEFTGRFTEFSVVPGECAPTELDVCHSILTAFKGAATRVSGAMSPWLALGFVGLFGAGGAGLYLAFGGPGVIGLVVAGAIIAGGLTFAGVASVASEARIHYNSLANDPPDPNFATVAEPVFTTKPRPADPKQAAVFEEVDRQRAYAAAALHALERYQGAVIAGDDSAAARQIDAFGEFNELLGATIERYAAAMRALAEESAAADPVLTSAERSEFAALQARLRSSGLSPAETASLSGQGLDATAIGAAKQQFLAVDLDDYSDTDTTRSMMQQAATEAELNVATFRAMASEAKAVAAEYEASTSTSPVAAFVVTPTTGPAPLHVAFDGSSSRAARGMIADHQWDFGDGGTAVGITASHTFIAPGAYEVRLTVVDSAGASALVSRTITVLDADNASPVAAFSATPNDVDPLTVTFRSTSSDADGEITSTAWDFGDGATASGEAAEHSFAAGEHTVTLTVTDDRGSTDLATATLRVVPANRPPVAKLAAHPDALDPTLLRFDAGTSSDPDGAITSYAWNFGDGTTATGVSVAHDFTDVGTHTVTLSVIDDDGATAIATAVVTVPPPNQPPLPSVVTTALSGAGPFEVSFDASASSDPDGAIVTYAWDFGDGDTSSGPVAHHIFVEPGMYDVRLMITDDQGATAMATGTVSVRDNAPPVAADDVLGSSAAVAFDALGNDIDADGDRLLLTEHTSPAHGTVTCDAMGGCLYVAADGFDGGDSFAYTVADGKGGTSSATVTIIVQPSPPVEETKAVDDLLITTTGAAATVDVLANDRGAQAILEHGDPSHGAATCTAAGACTYTPEATFAGADAFTYTIEGLGGQVTATVRVTVAATVTHAPVVHGAGIGAPVTGQVVAGGHAKWLAGAAPQPSGTAATPTLEREILVTLSGPHTIDGAFVQAAPGWSPSPIAGGLAVRADTGALLGEAIDQRLPAPGNPISQGTGGDGHVPILVGPKVFAFFHHSSPTHVTCIDRATGDRCPGYPVLLNMASDNIPGPAAVVGERIYVHLRPQSGDAFALYCWDAASDRPCGLTVLERGFHGDGSPPVLVDDRIWALGASGDLHCRLAATADPCATATVHTGLGDNSTRFDIVTHGGRVYVASESSKVACFDGATGQRCAGWPTNVSFSGGSNLVNRFSADGAPDGVCIVASAAAQCIADGGGDPAVSAGWPHSDGYYNEQQEAETGTRTFYGSLGRGGLGCWDWATMAVCSGPGFVDGWVETARDGELLPSAYGATFDGGCVVGLGDPGLLFTVSPSGSAPCASLGTGAQSDPVDLRNQRCDGSVGAARWRDVRVLDADLDTGDEFTSLIVVVRDATTGEMVATREMVGSAGTLDLSAVGVASHPALALHATGVSIAGAPAWADGIGPRLELRWHSDPAAICFRTTTAVDCAQAAPTPISITAAIGPRQSTEVLDLQRPASCQSNTAPITADQAVTTPADTPVTIRLGATDANGDPLTFAPGAPAHGTILPGATSGTLTYTPAPGFTGTDSFTFTASDGTASSPPATVTITVTPGALPPQPPQQPEPPDYVPLTPARLADTRPGAATIDDLFVGQGRRDARSVLRLQVGGRGGVPLDAAAVALNITATESTELGFVTVYPCDSPMPTASTLNTRRGLTVPNASIAKLAADGSVCLFNLSPTHLVVDVNGYYPGTTRYRSLVPARLVDTRPAGPTIDGLFSGAGSIDAGRTLQLQVRGRGGVPAEAAAVAMNVTVVDAGGLGFVTVYPCGTQPPTASNLNFHEGQTVPNAVVSKLAPDGTICLYALAAIDLVVDVTGYYPARSSYGSLEPARLLDTRPSAPTIDGRMSGTGIRPARSELRLSVLGRGGVPANATSVVLNVTATEPAALGFVTVFPCGEPTPTASNVNYSAGDTVPNMVIAKVGNDGEVCLFSLSEAHLVVDVTGYHV